MTFFTDGCVKGTPGIHGGCTEIPTTYQQHDWRVYVLELWRTSGVLASSEN